MKNENITEMDLHEAIRYLEKIHSCVIYGVLDCQSIEEDLSFHDLGARSVNKISKQEMLDAMEYASDANADANAQEYLFMVDLVAKYLITNHKPNPMNTRGGFSG
tara:strand:+ start:116 stop:430 length:315 start_codon:yes stop_codon:yes gene_type:complete